MPKISFRALSKDDAELVYREIVRSRESLSNLTWAAEATLTSVRTFLEDKSSASSTSLLIGLFHDNSFAGCLEIRNKGDFYEPGYWLGSSFRAKGILQKALPYVFAQLDMPVVAHVRKTNIKSISLLCNHGGMTVVDEVDGWVYLKKQ